MSWMMEHPWMTFFLALAAMEAASNIVSAICTAVVSCKTKSSGKAEGAQLTGNSDWDIL